MGDRAALVAAAAACFIIATLRKRRYSSRDSSPEGNDIEVFCAKCKSKVSHTAEEIQEDNSNFEINEPGPSRKRLQESPPLTNLIIRTPTKKPRQVINSEDQTKLLIAKVYHYLKQEYELLKESGTLDLTPLSKILQRTSLATGVSQKTVSQILKEEEERRECEEGSPKVGRGGRKRRRRRQTSSSSEDDASELGSDNSEDPDQQSHFDDNNDNSDGEVETLVIKMEPEEFHEEPEIFVGPADVKEEPKDDPIEVPVSTGLLALEVKTEPLDNIEDSTNNTPESTKRRGRKKQRTSDVSSTQQHSQGNTSTAVASSTIAHAKELDESSVLDETIVKVEQFEIHEEGFS